MNIYQLHVKGGNKDGEDTVRPIFVWKAPKEYRQFTLEMSDCEDFSNIIFLRDTRERFYVYDNAPLRRGKTYYVRVRSGLGEWSSTSFRTKE